MSWELKAISLFVLLVCSVLIANFAFGMVNHSSTVDFLLGLTLLFLLLVFWVGVTGNFIRGIIVALNKKEETKENGKKSDSSNTIQ